MAKNIFFRRCRHDSAYLFVRLLISCAAMIPRRIGLAVFSVAGIAIALFSSRDRAIARNGLTAIFGGKWTRRKIDSTVWQAYAELGKNAFDTLYLARRPPERLRRIVRHESLDEFRAAYDEGKGVVALTAHIGCFEMMLHYWAALGFNSFAIGRRLFDDRIDAIVRNLRSGPGIEYLYRDESLRRIISLLGQGRVMGALIDQDTKVDGVFAHFLGRLAFTPSGPIRLAMRYRLPVFVVTTARQADNTHLIYVSKRLNLEDTGDRRRDLVINVEKANVIISEAILRDPRQWVWMHRRWRKQPSDRDMKDIANIENYLNLNQISDLK
jgi:KDO2-lipid IV(A) lauroyltransferase